MLLSTNRCFHLSLFTLTRLLPTAYNRPNASMSAITMQQLTEQLVSWIREYISAANARGAVVGISGGIDSSVVSVLCKHAFPNSTLGLIMPCHSISTDAEHAYAVANKFQIPTRLIDLGNTFDALLRVLPGQESDPVTRKAAEANIKPRLRMTTLYYFAARLHYLVAGSGNKCELEIGYFTKHGDGGVDILPIGNLVKSQVCSLAEHLGIPRQIIDKPPSAGLWEGQTDEQEMGLTYEQLDLYCTTGQADEAVRGKIEGRIALNKHKRAMPPIPSF